MMPMMMSPKDFVWSANGPIIAVMTNSTARMVHSVRFFMGPLQIGIEFTLRGYRFPIRSVHLVSFTLVGPASMLLWALSAFRERLHDNPTCYIRTRKLHLCGIITK